MQSAEGGKLYLCKTHAIKNEIGPHTEEEPIDLTPRKLLRFGSILFALLLPYFVLERFLPTGKPLIGFFLFLVTAISVIGSFKITMLFQEKEEKNETVQK